MYNKSKGIGLAVSIVLERSVDCRSTSSQTKYYTILYRELTRLTNTSIFGKIERKKVSKSNWEKVFV